ncbi:MAG: PAS domain S-box protein [Betaproteobacteria bacterium]
MASQTHPKRKAGLRTPPGRGDRTDFQFSVFGEIDRRNFEASPYPIRIFDRETLRYLAVNDAALKLYGYSREEFLQLTPLDTRDPGERSQIVESLAEPTGYLRRLPPRRHMTKQGEIVVVELIVQDIMYRGHKARLSLTMNVTQRVRTEEKLRQREREFGALAENSPDIVARFDRDLRLLYVNLAASRALGLPIAAFIGKTSRDVGVPGSLAAVWEAEVKRVLETRAEHTVEFQYAGHDGTRYFQTRLIPEAGPDGTVETVLTTSRDISARKRAEEAEKRSTERLHLAVEAARLALWDADTLNGEVFLSGQWAAMLGGPPGETRTTVRELLDLVHPEDRERLVDAAVLALKGQRPEYSEEHRVRTATGEWRWVTSTGRVTERSPDGRAVRMIGINCDITERKRAEEELKRQKRLLETIVESLPVGVFLKDAKTLRLVMRNRANRGMMKCSAEEEIGKTPHELYPKALADYIAGIDRKVLETGEMIEIPEQEVISQSGNLIVQHVRKVPVPDESGKPWLLLGISDDVTERRRTERALRASEEFLRRMIESSRDCIKVLDMEGRITWVNPGGQALMEAGKAAFIGKSYLDFWNEAEREAACNALAAARAGNIGRFEGYCATAAGTAKWWDEIVTPICGSDGKPEKILVASRDITESKQAQRELQRQKNMFEAVFENLPIAVFIKDAQTLRFVRTNRFARRTLGHPVESAAQKTVHDLFPADQAGRFDATDREALVTRRMVEIPEQEVLGRAGDVRVQHVRKVPVFDEKGEPWVLVGIAEDITVRKRTEEELARQKRLLDAIIDNLPLAVFVTEPFTGRHMMRNRIAREWFGALPRAGDGAALNEPGTRDPADQTPAMDRRAFDTRQMVESFEEQALGPSGRRRIQRVRKVPLFDEHDRPWMLVGIADDITEQTRREEELKRQKKLLDAVIECLPVGVTVKDARTLRYLLRNRMAEKLTGLSDAATRGKRADEVWPPDFARFINASDSMALAGRTPVRGDFTMLRQLRGRIVRNLKVPVPDDRGKYTHIVSILEDLTDIETAHAALRRSEEHLRQLISMSPAAIYSFSLAPPFDTTYISDMVTVQVGWPPSEFTNGRDFWIEHVHPEDRPRVLEAIQLIESDGHFACTYRFQHKNGSWRWMHDEARLVRNADGTPQEGIGIWVDVTEQHQASEERVQRTIRQRDALVKEVHHRIKNHLQGIAGLLRQKVPAHPAVAPLLESVVAQMKSVALVYGLQEGADAPVSVQRVVDAICTSLEALLPCRLVRRYDARHALTLAGSAAVPVAVALNELMYNAVKHGEHDPDPPTVEVEYAERGARAEIRIANSGRLPSGFDYASGAGCGTGLDLVKTLLDPKGSTVEIRTRGGDVVTELMLGPPLVMAQPVLTAA